MQKGSVGYTPTRQCHQHAWITAGRGLGRAGPGSAIADAHALRYGSAFVAVAVGACSPSPAPAAVPSIAAALTVIGAHVVVFYDSLLIPHERLGRASAP